VEVFFDERKSLIVVAFKEGVAVGDAVLGGELANTLH